MKMNILHPGMLSCCSLVRLCATLFTVARQAPLSMGFFRQNTGVGCHSPWMERGCLTHLCIPCGPACPSSLYRVLIRAYWLEPAEVHSMLVDT